MEDDEKHPTSETNNYKIRLFRWWRSWGNYDWIQLFDLRQGFALLLKLATESWAQATSCLSLLSSWSYRCALNTQTSLFYSLILQ
jgi:hypothetical protein